MVIGYTVIHTYIMPKVLYIFFYLLTRFFVIRDICGWTYMGCTKFSITFVNECYSSQLVINEINATVVWNSNNTGRYCSRYHHWKVELSNASTELFVKCQSPHLHWPLYLKHRKKNIINQNQRWRNSNPPETVTQHLIKTNRLRV